VLLAIFPNNSKSIISTGLVGDCKKNFVSGVIKPSIVSG
jgi:hypothetical protein